MINEKSKGAITINDVARLAGVSKRTVSRVINNAASVNAETRSKIQAIIDQYDYAPSKQARGLASSRSYLVGMLSDDPNAIVIHSVQRGVISSLSPQGYELVVHPLNHRDPKLIDDVLRFVNRSNLDGLVILPPISMNEELLARLNEEKIHFVALAAREVVEDISHCIVSSDRLAMEQVADLFVKTGVSRPAFIEGPKDRLSTIERREGLVAALAKRGFEIDAENFAEGDFSYSSGLRAAKQLLNKRDRPDAIFACNDQMAIAAIHVAQDMAIDIPNELQIVGYDDEPMAARLRPSLTTLQRPNIDMAKAAGYKIMALIQEEVCEAETYFTPRLIVRDSTK
jgi:LacI family transcriptional regulator